MYIPVLILWIKGCQLSRKYVYGENHHNPFGSGLTSVNEVSKCVVLILDDIIVSEYK